MIHGRWLWLALALTLAACPKKATGPATDDDLVVDENGPACDAVSDHFVTVLRQGGEIGDDKAGPLREAVLRLCAEDEWSGPARGCFAAAEGGDGLETCGQQHLSEEAFRHAGTEIDRILDEGDTGRVDTFEE